MIQGSVVNAEQVPARIERLAAEKRYYAAVQLHLQSISMLDREGIQSVRTSLCLHEAECLSLICSRNDYKLVISM